MINKKRLESLITYLKEGSNNDPQSRVDALRKKINNKINDDNDDSDDSDDGDDGDDHELYKKVEEESEKLNNKISNDNYEEEFNDEEELEKLEKLDKRFKRLINKISDDNDDYKKLNNEEVKIKERPKELNNLPKIGKIKTSNKSLEKVIKESKNLLKAVKKYDENKKCDGDKLDNLIKELNNREKAKIEYTKKTDEKLKKYYENEA